MQDNKASRMFLLVAVALGVLATIMAFVFISSSAGVDRTQKAKILVAAHDLRPNVAIDPDRDFKVQEIPQSSAYAYLLNATIKYADRATYKGQKLNCRIPANQPIFLRDFSAGIEIVWIGPDSRVLTINALPGIAVPGDYVQVVNAKGELLAGGKTFRVIAVAGLMYAPVIMGDPNTSGSTAPKPVSLELTQAQASELLKGIGPNQERVSLLICPPPATPETRPAP